MAKATGVLRPGVLRRWRVAAQTRLERFEAAAERAAGEILEKSYRETAEQSLRGAEAVDKILDSRKAARGRAEKKRIPKKAKPKSGAAKKILGAVRKRAVRKSPAPKRKGR